MTDLYVKWKREIGEEYDAFISSLPIFAENARLQARVEEAEAQVSGMQEEGCAARGLVENIFNGLTTRGEPVDPVLAQMAEAAAKLLFEVTPCNHKALAERRKVALKAQKAAHDYRFGPAGEEAETGEEMNAFMYKAQELDETAWQLTHATIEEEEK